MRAYHSLKTFRRIHPKQMFSRRRSWRQRVCDPKRNERSGYRKLHINPKSDARCIHQMVDFKKDFHEGSELYLGVVDDKLSVVVQMSFPWCGVED
ncbi:hypothetical protein AVEN_211167-1 [Araneus ventricosus]|uniref:Uncharacterized protein n=1 Tax=Araneus ventricosus TaxID=182803 RepID=A0A4Y2MC33_ARAVE|nr:hypothetical protein AVEN_211167-1 [Araneus ventricosus]